MSRLLKTSVACVILQACESPPNPATAPDPAESARTAAQRWVIAEGLGDRTSGPGATVGIGSASLDPTTARDPNARQMALRSAEFDARAEIARARGERVATSADASGSAVVTAETDLVRLRGASVIRTEEASGAAGVVEFAVVVRADPPDEAPPPATGQGEARSAADQAVERLTVSPTEWARSLPMRELARSTGARRVAGPDGVVCIVAFGTSTVREGGRDAMGRERARMEALAAIRRFIDEDVTSGSSASDRAVRSPDGTVTAGGTSVQVTETSRSDSMALPGAAPAFQWRMVNDDGTTTVGVVMLARDPTVARGRSDPAKGR